MKEKIFGEGSWIGEEKALAQTRLQALSIGNRKLVVLRIGVDFNRV